MEQGQPDNLDAFMDLGGQDIARLVLCLLIEEALEGRLAHSAGDGSGQEDRNATTRLSTRTFGTLTIRPVIPAPHVPNKGKGVATDSTHCSGRFSR